MLKAKVSDAFYVGLSGRVETGHADLVFLPKVALFV